MTGWVGTEGSWLGKRAGPLTLYRRVDACYTWVMDKFDIPKEDQTLFVGIVLAAVLVMVVGGAVALLVMS